MAIGFTIIETAKLRSVDARDWLKLVFAQIADQKITSLDELLPLNFHHLEANEVHLK